MGEYLIGVVIASSALGAVTYLSYHGASERTVRLCATVLLLYTVLCPAFSLIKSLNADFDADFNVEIPDGAEYEQVAESAFKEGISKLLFTKYGINPEDAEVYVFNFSFENMRAEKIKILLSGSGALADWRGIESYVAELGLGECEVNVKIG